MIRHWFARQLCRRGWHSYERRGSWSRCIRQHRPVEATAMIGKPVYNRYLCYVEEVRAAYDHGKGRIWLR